MTLLLKHLRLKFTQSCSTSGHKSACITSVDKQVQPAFVVAFLGAVSRDDARLVLLEALCRLSARRPTAERAVLFLRTDGNAHVIDIVFTAFLKNCVIAKVL